MNNTDRATAGPGSDGLASAQPAQVSPSTGQDDPGPGKWVTRPGAESGWAELGSGPS